MRLAAGDRKQRGKGECDVLYLQKTTSTIFIVKYCMVLYTVEIEVSAVYFHAINQSLSSRYCLVTGIYIYCEGNNRPGPICAFQYQVERYWVVPGSFVVRPGGARGGIRDSTPA